MSPLHLQRSYIPNFVRSVIPLLISLMTLIVILICTGTPRTTLAQPTSTDQAHTLQTAALTVPQVITTVSFPSGIAQTPLIIDFNPNTGYGYVAGKSGVAVITGTQVITAFTFFIRENNGWTRPLGINPTTGYVYIGAGSTAYVVSGTKVVYGFPIANYPQAIGVNPSTGYAYITHKNVNVVEVVSGTEVVNTLAVSGGDAIGVNPETGLVYLGSGAILSGTQIWGTLPATGNAIAVNPANGYVYIANSGTGTVYVVTGTQVISTVVVGGSPWAVGVNPATGYAYVPDYYGNKVTVLSGTQILATPSAGYRPGGVAINPATGYVYIANRYSADVTIISGTQVVASPVVDPYPWNVGVNPVTGLAYSVNYLSNNVNVFSGIEIISTLPGQTRPQFVGVNPTSGYAYVVNSGSNDVSVVRDTEIITTLSANSRTDMAWYGLTPSGVTVNPASGYVYVPYQASNSLMVISGTQIVSNVWPLLSPYATGGSLAVGVNPTTGYIYVAGWDNDLWQETVVVLSATEIITRLTIPTGGSVSSPNYIEVNPITGYVYLTDGRRLTVLSGTAIITQVLTGGAPGAIGVNPVTNYVYVADASGSLVILSGTDIITSISEPIDYYPNIAVNPTTGYIYVSNDDVPGTVTVLSGTQVVTTISVGDYPGVVAADPVSGFVYVDADGITILSSTQIIATLPNVFGARSIGVNPVSGFVYVPQTYGSSGYSFSRLSIIGQPLPLIPTSQTPPSLSSPQENILIDFGEPVITTTVTFEISPTVALTVTWDNSNRLARSSGGVPTRAVVQHALFQTDVTYTLRLLPGGQTLSGRPIAEQQFTFIFSEHRLFLPAILK